MLFIGLSKSGNFSLLIELEVWKQNLEYVVSIVFCQKLSSVNLKKEIDNRNLTSLNQELIGEKNA